MYYKGKTVDYKSPALTAELQAHLNCRVKHNTALVTNPESIRDCSNSEFSRASR
jgi:hypothetical protein